MKWPQRPFLWPCGLIGWDTSHQEGSKESGQKAIEKALGASAESGPKDLFHGFVPRLAGILPTKRVQENRATRPKRPLGPMRKVAHPNQSSIGPQGHRKGRWGHISHCPQGPFLWPCGSILLNPPGGKYPSQSGHKAIEKALGDTS